MGINTEWGLLMASISEDSGEETPLQVWSHNFYLLFMSLHGFIEHMCWHAFLSTRVGILLLFLCRFA